MTKRLFFSVKYDRGNQDVEIVLTLNRLNKKVRLTFNEILITFLNGVTTKRILFVVKLCMFFNIRSFFLVRSDNCSSIV